MIKLQEPLWKIMNKPNIVIFDILEIEIEIDGRNTLT